MYGFYFVLTYFLTAKYVSYKFVKIPLNLDIKVFSKWIDIKILK